MRLLILACGATKRPDPGLLPAIERYDGPPYRTLRKALRELAQDRHPDILILSAAYGLIRADSPIPTYDRRMTADRARQLRPQVLATLATHLAVRSYAETLINLGADYMPALPLDAALSLRLGAIHAAAGGIGSRMGQLRRWLHEPARREAAAPAPGRSSPHA